MLRSSSLAFDSVSGSTHRWLRLLVQQNCSVHKQNIYEKLNIPTKPKKPPTPFLRFFQLVRPTLVKEYPDLKHTELPKIAAQRWSTIDSTLKSKILQEYKDDSENYLNKKNEYDNQITPEQKAEIKRAELHIMDVKAERKTKKKSKELGKPKQPLTVFMRFLATKSSERTKYPEYKDWLKAMSEEWKTISPSVKTKLEEDRKRDYEKWNIVLKAWEEKMMKEGNVDVVRTKSLLAPPKTRQKK